MHRPRADGIPLRPVNGHRADTGQPRSDFPVIQPDRWFRDFATLDIRDEVRPSSSRTTRGYLTLSLIIPLWTDLLDVRNVTTSVNYGLNKVRFTTPVPAGSHVRLHG